MFFNIKEIKSKNIDVNITTHEQDFLKIIDLSKKLDEKPSEIYIYAVQPKNLTYNHRLSKIIKEKIELYLKDIKEKISKII